MNIPSVYTSVFAVFCIFIITINANLEIISIDPNTTISNDTHIFKIESTNKIINIREEVTDTSTANSHGTQTSSNNVYDTHESTILTSIGTTESFTGTINTGMSSGAYPTTTVPTLPRGESPPTRSAQLGMGLGITFIAVLLIGEIIYFKCFYRGGQRRGSYSA